VVTADYYRPDSVERIDFLQSWVENCWHRLGIEPTTLDINSLSGAYDLLAMATP